MSPRCKKPRKCQCPFKDGKKPVFKPAGIPSSELERVVIYEDELEAMRLCDVEGLTQEQAGEQMGVSRGTVQRLLESGRKKVISSILEKKSLVVE
ncbi:MAG: DUF134 domain-containing protein [bacterium]